MVAMVMLKLVLVVCSYICHNMLYCLVEKQSFSVLKICGIECTAISKMSILLRHGVEC